MKKLAIAVLLAAISTGADAVSQKNIALTCNGNQTAFEQNGVGSVEQHLPLVYNFTVKPNTELNIEAASPHGATLMVSAGDSTKQDSVVEVSADTTPKTVRVGINSGPAGKLLVRVELPKIIISGQQTPPNQPYTLKINCL